MTPFDGVPLPFEGLPLVYQAILTVTFAVIVGMALWAVSLYVRGARALRNAPEAPVGGADAWHWVFMVPALNEQITIRDSVERLTSLGLRHRTILVIDDGSDDRTPEIMASIDHPDVHTLRRDLPDARRGKAEALNDAYRTLTSLLGDVDRDRVIVCIVDADGRIAPDGPRYAAAHFADPEVGGVQSLVRIYNRNVLLTRMQHLEFSVYARVYQAGRNRAGTAGMGGNGQYNRLAGLDAIVDGGPGPWRDRLTEDQDVGLRLLAAGWRSHQEVRAAVDQQGVPRLRPLFRQRTRWSQGNLQALGLAGAVWRAPLPLSARLEEVMYLFMPIWQGVVGVGFVTAIVLVATEQAPLVPGPVALLLAYGLAFSNTILGCLASRTTGGWRSWVTALALAHAYALYTWLLWPVLVRSTLRMLGTRSDWARTEREPLQSAPDAA